MLLWQRTCSSYPSICAHPTYPTAGWMQRCYQTFLSYLLRYQHSNKSMADWMPSHHWTWSSCPWLVLRTSARYLLKATASMNMPLMLVTWDTPQQQMGWLKVSQRRENSYPSLCLYPNTTYDHIWVCIVVDLCTKHKLAFWWTLVSLPLFLPLLMVWSNNLNNCAQFHRHTMSKESTIQSEMCRWRHHFDRKRRGRRGKWNVKWLYCIS